MPAKPKSAVRFFNEVNVPKVMERKGFSQQEANKICHNMWEEVTENGKKKYLEMHLKDVKRYEKQLLDLSNQGFFKMDDGSKSTDECHKILKKRKMPETQDKSKSPTKKQKTD